MDVKRQSGKINDAIDDRPRRGNTCMKPIILQRFSGCAFILTFGADRLGRKDFVIYLLLLLNNIFHLFLIYERFESWEALSTSDKVLGGWGVLSVPMLICLVISEFCID
jgi:hypothetical protein